ncbi:MAG: hypothetical protein EXR71_04830 [Myxococcales bacterium]|nr:hypothetical protein [Myxococcales bacterium]
MARWLAAWLLLAGCGLFAARWVIRPVQDTWSLVAAGRGGTLLLAHYSVANTGLFADQLTTRVVLLRPDAAPLVHRAISGPATIDDRGVHAPADRFEQGEEGWDARVDGVALRLRAQVRGAGGPCPPTVGTLSGVLEFPDASASSEGARLAGPALVVRTHYEGGPVASGALYAIDQTGAIVIDNLSTCPGAVVLDGRAVAVESPWISPTPEDSFTLTLAGHHVRVELQQRVRDEPAFDGTLLAEAWLARAAGYREPHVRSQLVRVRVDDRRPWHGVLLLRDNSGSVNREP